MRWFIRLWLIFQFHTLVCAWYHLSLSKSTLHDTIAVGVLASICPASRGQDPFGSISKSRLNSSRRSHLYKLVVQFHLSCYGDLLFSWVIFLRIKTTSRDHDADYEAVLNKTWSYNLTKKPKRLRLHQEYTDRLDQFQAADSNIPKCSATKGLILGNVFDFIRKSFDLWKNASRH